MAALPKEIAHEENYLQGGGLLGWLTTIDHKRIAVMYGLTTLFFFLLGGVEALFIRLQLARPDGHVLSADMYNQIFTMHGTTMVFLVVMPVGLGFFANFVVPLQIGARDVAYPRINALSYWIFLMGALFLNVGWLHRALPDAGWFGYANLTERMYTPGLNVDYWSIGLLISGVGSIMAGLNFFVTIINMRAPGMTFMRMPLFVWSVLVMFILILVAFPPLTVGLIFLTMDRLYGTHFYSTTVGGTPLLWQHLFWLFGHPEVYIMVLPAFGIMSEVVPCFSRKALFGYPMMAYSTVLIGFLSYGVWAHHMFAVGMGPVADAAFAVTSMIIAIPTGIKIFSWIATIWGGNLRLDTPFLFAIGFIIEFTIGGVSGIMHAQPPVDLVQTDTYFVVAHFHYVLFGGSAFALFAGTYYWWPKVTGRLLDEKLGKLHFWLTVIGFNLTFFPMHFLGSMGMPRRIYRYQPGLGFDMWNMVCTIGAFILAFSVLIFLINVMKTRRSGKLAGNDPWDGRTLEWTIPSPPPAYNFVTLPSVYSRDPFWAEKYGGEFAHGHVPAAGHAEHGHSEHEEHIHMPPASIYPLLMAVGMTVGGVGLLTWTRVAITGAVIVILAVIGMSFEHHDAGIDDAEGTEGTTGLDNRKVGIWSFIGSESIFFASLIATYLVYKGRDFSGPSAETILEIPLVTFTTFILLMSSLVMVLAQDAFLRGNQKWGRYWLFATIAFGSIFVGGQVYEFTHFYHEGMSFGTNLFSQTFYTLVGFHGTHVAIGVLWLIVLAIASFAGWLNNKRQLAVEMCALYWHFVDIVWIVIFSVIYLMRAVA